MEQPTFLQKYKWYILGFFVLVVPLVTLIILLLSNVFSPAETPKIADRTNVAAEQKAFRILTTVPRNGEQEVSTEEQLFSFTTDVPVLSEKEFRISITPPFAGHSLRSTYPTRTIYLQELGGLKPSTTYRITVSGRSGKLVHTWQFRTADEQPEAASGLERKINDELVADYYPLSPFVPYISDNFDLDYTDRLTLSVRIKNRDTEKVKRDVEIWIKSRGVDPKTHIINYTNAF